jgi:curved DNA-binding protein CbpA
MERVWGVGLRFFRLYTNGHATPSHYNLLGVSRKATKVEIRSAFLALSKKHHPDLNPASKSEEAHKKFRDVNEAYTVLMDPAKRSLYDQWLRGYSNSHFTSPVTGQDEDKFGFYKYDPRTNTYTYARAYQYNHYNEKEWEAIRRSARSQRSHSTVLRFLVILVLLGSLRVFFVRKQHHQNSRASKKNAEIYQAVRERGRTSTVKEQLDRLHRHQQKSEQNRKH